MESRHPLVAGNWKLNGTRSGVAALAEAVSTATAQFNVEVLVCPSFVHLSDVLNVVGNSPVHLGAQDCHEVDSGAFTGETSAAMLAEFGCEYVIVGHSERRQFFADSDKRVGEKFLAVQRAGMTPILCVGETLDEREAGQVTEVIERQLQAVVDADQSTAGSTTGATCFSNAVIAYEPVWAIGTGKTATPDQAQDVHSAIRGWLSSKDSAVADRIRILYGGSVNAGNAEALFAQIDIDGALVGGASLKADEFAQICEAATRR